MARLLKRATAKRDLVEHFVYLAEHAGMEIADRFLLQADASFQDPALHPLMGVALDVGHAELAGIRKWQVAGFEKFLIFYLPCKGGVSIVRVLHAAQDWWNLLEII